MIKRAKHQRSYESLNLLWATAIGIAFFTTSVFLSWSEFAKLMETDLVHFVLAALLALVTFFLFFVYMMATHHELHLLDDYLGENPIPRIMPKIYMVTFGLAILFGALFALSRNLLAYATVMVFYNLFDLWGNSEVAKHIGPPIEQKLSQANNAEEKEPFLILRSFYFERHTLPRIVTIMFMNWIAVCLALVFFLTGNDLARNAGYGLLMTNILIGEIVIHAWRVRSIYKL